MHTVCTHSQSGTMPVISSATSLDVIIDQPLPGGECVTIRASLLRARMQQTGKKKAAERGQAACGCVDGWMGVGLAMLLRGWKNEKVPIEWRHRTACARTHTRDGKRRGKGNRVAGTRWCGDGEGRLGVGKGVTGESGEGHLSASMDSPFGSDVRIDMEAREQK